MYKLGNPIPETTTVTYVVRLSNNACIPFDPANVDFANFKKEINEGTAQLEDADGNLMTPQQAKDFVKELP